MIIGCDFHTRYQQSAMMNDAALEDSNTVPEPSKTYTTTKKTHSVLCCCICRAERCATSPSTPCAVAAASSSASARTSARSSITSPGTFQVERHVRGKWVCRSCERLIQAPVPAQIIDKGIPTAGLLAHVLVSKYADHQPLYRLEGILERAEVRLPRSTLGQWSGACGVQLTPLAQAMKVALLSRTVLHADETPVPMLKPGLGHTHRAYLWSYGTTQFDPLPLVVYDFAESRGGHHARAFLGGWSGKLVCDDFSGYKALFERGVIEIGCMAHARRKFHDLHENQRSEIAAEALVFFGALYDIETEAREQQLDAIGRQRLRQARARPVADHLRKWLIRYRSKVPDGSATAKAIEYSLGRWEALIRYIEDGDLPIDNNWFENRIRPVALGRSELALRRIPARRPARRGHHEPDPVRQAQRPRSVSLSQGRARAPADTTGKPHRRTPAASLATNVGTNLLTYHEKCAQTRGLCPDHGWVPLHALSRYQSKSYDKHLSLVSCKWPTGKDWCVDNGHRRNRLCAVIHPPKSRLAKRRFAREGEFASRLRKSCSRQQ